MVEYNRDNESGEFYRINKNKLLVRWDTWEIWKGNNKTGWIKTEDVKRKDYQEYIKTNNREFEKELIDVGEITYFITLKDAEKLQEKVEKERHQEEEKELLENQLREDLDKSIRAASRELDKINISTLSIEEVRKYQAYMDIILKNLKTGDIKDTKTTREVNKINRLELYKNTIDNYIKEGKYSSINRLCKDLKINRATFYNLELNEYVNRVLNNKI